MQIDRGVNKANKAQGRLLRMLYRKRFAGGYRPTFTAKESLPVEIYTLSCERDFPEQVACICSFLKWVGTPERFVIVSDGSMTPTSVELLKKIHSCVEVTTYDDFVRKDLPPFVNAYAAGSPLGKKLAVEMSIPVTRATIYSDSDILFFSGGQALADVIRREGNAPWQLVDVGPTFDARIMENDLEYWPPVNAGFFLMKQPLNFENAIGRLSRLDAPITWTEQTVIHLTLRQNGAELLPRDKFVLQLADEFCLGDFSSSHPIAMRHYVSGVRHKMWLSLRHSL